MIWFQIELQHRSLQRHISRHHQARGEGGANRLLVLDQKPSDREYDTEEHDHLAIKLSALMFLKYASCQGFREILSGLGNSDTHADCGCTRPSGTERT